MAFIEQPLFIDGFQCPPNGFNVIIGIGNIGMLHVRPITDGIAHLFPFAFIFPNRLLAFVNKRKHAVTLDLLLAVQSEQLFHFKFNGKSVRIPTRFAQHVKAFHRAVAGNDILHGAGQNMPDMRPAVSCGRSVIESVSRFALGLFNGFLEDAVCLPEFQNLFLSRNKVERGGNFFVHCSNTPFLLRKFLKIKNRPEKRDDRNRGTTRIQRHNKNRAFALLPFNAGAASKDNPALPNIFGMS